MSPPIAVVGLGCVYPDAHSPGELWENVLAGRRAFRRIPPERLRDADYWSPNRAAPDRTYSRRAAVIEGWEFDRLKFRVAASTYRSADPAHWLALDVAARALEDAGFAEGSGLPRETTGVLLGNTLTGEVSRANGMRLRWPYVRRTVDAALAEQGWSPERRAGFLGALESRYKEPFPAIGEESRAGGLSSTISGRICDHFDLKGGGYAVDGACSSSLLAVANASRALADGELDVALAGGVDLGLDPFEIVGLAKTGVLAPEEMLVYDRRSQGFWPGEGCGFAVLLRREDAVERGLRIYACVRGWGISSDGAGGITRPEVEGQLLAVRRAYARAGFGPEEVAYFEGHGAGTAVGDATELRVLGRARAEAGARTKATIGTVKANIGHTKAAAGIAGFLKAVLALHHGILPPTTGTRAPHAELERKSARLEILPRGAPWPATAPLRAAVNSTGFGGINAHVVLEAESDVRPRSLGPLERRLVRSPQDAELFAFAATNADELRERVGEILRWAPGLSLAESADLAAALSAIASRDEVRAACVAASPEELVERLATLEALLEKDTGRALDVSEGCFLGTGKERPRVGYLFPGQGAPAHLRGGHWARRFDDARELWEDAALPGDADGVHTAVAQPAIVTASRAALRVLERLGFRADVAVGHGLGELTALHWAGAYDGAALLRIAAARGRAMAELGSATGAMASLGAGADRVGALLAGTDLVIAGLDAPDRTVVAGGAAEIECLMERAAAYGIRAARLAVSHAFHSPHVAAAAAPFAARLAGEAIGPPIRSVVSTVTGRPLGPADDLRELLVGQVTRPVRFEAAMRTAGPCDLWIEVGPGQMLADTTTSFVAAPVVGVDAGGESLRGLLAATGAAFALGAAVDPAALFADRHVKPFPFARKRIFLANPCESAPASDVPAERSPEVAPADGPVPVPAPDGSLLETVPDSAPAGVGPWVRAFRVELVERPAPVPAPRSRPAGGGRWRVFGPRPRAERLSGALARAAPGPGVAVWLAPDPESDEIELLLRAARAALESPEDTRFLVVQEGGSAGPLARTLHLEAPRVAVTVCDLPLDGPDAVERAAREAGAGHGYREVHYDARGRRTEPVLRLRPRGPSRRELDAMDVLLVVGGGEGVGAACALEVARRCGTQLALMGRSSPGEDEVLAAILEPMPATGPEVRYVRADVSDPEAVRRAFREIESELGPVTAVIHAVGENVPARLGDLDAEAFRRAVDPTVEGARNVLAAADPERLHTFVALGSISRRTGLPGEAHDAVANERLARVVDAWSAGSPRRRGLVLDWSVGAGARGAALRDLGVTPIPVSDAARTLVELLEQEDARGSIVVTGRLGNLPTLGFETAEVPPLRFLETVRVHVPGVEIVTDARVSRRSDPYVDDQVLGGERLFPAVLGLEAMAETWRGLTGRDDRPAFEDVEFPNPVVVPEEGPVTVRCAALARGDGDAVDLVLRTDANDFRVEHFRATCRPAVDAAGAARTLIRDPRLEDLTGDPAALLPDPGRDLYGKILFQAGRFRRLRRYLHLRATECVAEVGPAPAEPWFERTLPDELVLGDAGARDAALHAVQACIPHAVVLPVGADAIEFGPPASGPDEGALIVRARERSRGGGLFVCDLEIVGGDGRVREAWRGLRLRTVETTARWESVPALLAPWVERRLGDLVPGADVRVTLAEAGSPGDDRFRHRPDGTPGNGVSVSVARSEELTLAVAGRGPLGCDLEAVVERSPSGWGDLLGGDGWSLATVLAGEGREGEALAATRVRAATACLKKAGAPDGGEVSFVARSQDGWMLLSAGSLVTATVPLPGIEGVEPVVLAIATRPGDP